MSKCTHEHTSAGTHYGYTASVAVHPYTTENPAAAGGITYTETCTRCGARRQVNANGVHAEFGTWGPSAAARAERERAERLAQQRAQAKVDATAARAVGVSVRGVEPVPHADDPVVVIGRRGKPDQSVRLSALEAAATQEDIGDALVPSYRHLVRTARRQIKQATREW